jgi:hypothetical protein
MLPPDKHPISVGIGPQQGKIKINEVGLIVLKTT